MQNHTTTSSQRLNRAKEHLKESLIKLERLIQKQKNTRTKVINNLDAHIANLETILKNYN